MYRKFSQYFNQFDQSADLFGGGGSNIINNMETTAIEHQFATFEIYP